MRNRLFIGILLLMCTFVASAADYVFHGQHYIDPAPLGVDAVVVFEDLSATDAYIEYTGLGTPSWRDFSGNVLASGVGDYYPTEGGVVLYVDDRKEASVWVINYANPAYRFAPSADALTAVPDCKKTQLTLTVSIPSMTYMDTVGTKHLFDRQPVVSYTNLGWSGTEWQDSAATDPLPLAYNLQPQEFELPALLRNSAYCLTIDAFAASWGARDSLCSEEVEAIAVAMHPASVTTSRNYNGKGVENEPQRPIDESTLTGSAPLEINFLSNANKPVAEFYRWRITKGSDLIAERFDEDQRYTFMTNGSYEVKVWAYNSDCMTDSAVFKITVDESLLKVPNVFTPNGDGTNDEFRVVYKSLAEFHCWIYNRWGQLVYKWDDPAKGWDGTINGRPAAEGAYYYVIRARGTNADPSDKYHKVTKRRPADVGVYQLSGHINLVR